MPQPASAHSPSWTIEAKLLGGCTLRCGGRTLTAEAFGRRRAWLLLLHLLSTPGHRLPRDLVLETLWPEQEPGAADAGLRVVLSLLRAGLDAGPGGASPISGRGPLIGLHPDLALHIDADLFEAAATQALSGGDRAALRAALALYSGPFLPDISYDDWATTRRDSLALLHRRLLTNLAAQEAVDDPAAAEWRLRDLLAASPTDEPAAQALMDLLATAGRRVEALRVYQALAGALDQDLGVAPDPRTEARRARLLAQVPPAAPTHAGDTAVGDTPRTNLPAPATSFIGREWEQAEVRGLLTRLPAEGRLLTLTGPGGCGKTRLALQVAGSLLPRYPEGVWLVDLAGLPSTAHDDPEPLAYQVAAAMGLHDLGRTSPALLPALSGALAGRHLLLLLDNCEHLIESCAALATTLLRACPSLHILTTSREALGMLGESTWLVPPLSLPPSGPFAAEDEATPARLARYEAVRLFLERARATTTTVALTDRNAPAIARICRRLDGIPLAIELAAAQLHALAVEELAARLDDRFRVLASGNRAALPRHRTLQAVMDWSYALLAEPERALLRRLVTFPGGCTLDAAEAVCADPPANDAQPHQPAAGYTAAGTPIPPSDVLMLLSHLVAKSLVQVDHPPTTTHDPPGQTRYTMLETVRQYALAKRDERGDGEAHQVEARLQAWCLELAQRAASGLAGPDAAVWLALLEREHDNILPALESTLRDGRIDLGMHLATALWRFWHMRGYLREGQRWLERLLARTGDAAPPTQVRAHHALGAITYYQGKYAEAARAFAASQDLAGRLGDDPGRARALNGLASALRGQGDYTGAAAAYEQSIALSRQAADPQTVAAALANFAETVRAGGDYRRATALYRESLAIFRSLGHPPHIAMVLYDLGRLTFLQGDHHAATIYLAECLALCEQLGDARQAAMVLLSQGAVAQHQGDDDRAHAAYSQSLTRFEALGNTVGIAAATADLSQMLLRRGAHAEASDLADRSLALYREMGDTLGIAHGLLAVADVAEAGNDPQHAAQLYGESLDLLVEVDDKLGIVEAIERFAHLAHLTGHHTRMLQLAGAATAFRAAAGAPRPAYEQAALDRRLAAARAALGDEAYEPTWAAAQTLSLTEAVALARSH